MFDKFDLFVFLVLGGCLAFMGLLFVAFTWTGGRKRKRRG